jgi:bacteriocin-like protein
MNKYTMGSSNLATLDDHDTLTDTELNAVTGGMLYLPAPQNGLSPQVFQDHSSPSQFHVLIGP